jgi:transmembrane sensor
MEYSDYTVADFIADEYFEKWVNRPDAEVNAFWKAWVTAHPEKKPMIEEARHIISLMQFRGERYSKEEAHNLLHRINRVIDENGNTFTLSPLKPKHPSLPKTIKFRYSIAAVLAVLMTGVMAYLLFPHSSEAMYATSYGEKKFIILPDSSKVTLNANSSLHYNADWSGDEIREVFLHGEAFFEVRKQPYAGGYKFVVHTQKMDVEVLGTVFNVSQREDITTVTLNEGAVKLNSDKVQIVKNVMLAPGEQAELIGEENFNIRQVNTELFTAWKDNKLVFENTTIQEIARIIAHNYGQELVVLDMAIFQRKFTGTLPGNNIDIILKTFSGLYGLNIERNENQIFLK